MRYSHIYIYTIQLYSGYTTILNHNKSPVIYLIGGFKHVLFSMIYGIIHPIDFHIFQDG